MESKIHNDIKNNRNQELNEMKFAIDTLKSKVDALKKEFNDEDQGNKAILKDLQEGLKLTERKDNFEQSQREIDIKIKEMLIKL